MEYYARELEATLEGANRVVRDDWDEGTFRSYFYWSLNDDLVVGLENRYENFEAEIRNLTMVPEEMETHHVPINISYFHRSSGFGRLAATFVDQQIVPIGQSETPLSDDFVVMDLSAGYRLPKRFGILSVSVRNLFDQHFEFMDTAMRSSQAIVAPLYVPERSFLFRVTFSF